MSEINKIAIFQQKEMRKIIYNDEWWFVIEDPELARSVEIAFAISPTVSVESFRHYPGSIIKQLADKFQFGINNNQIESSGFQVRPHE